MECVLARVGFGVRKRSGERSDGLRSAQAMQGGASVFSIPRGSKHSQSSEKNAFGALLAKLPSSALGKIAGTPYLEGQPTGTLSARR